MDKKEVFEKVQNKKQEYDEMELQILERSMRISTLVVPILVIIFILIRFMNPNISVLNIADLVTVVFAELCVSKTYEYIKLRKKSDLIISILSFIICICLIILYMFPF